MRNRAVGEFAFAAAILCSFFAGRAATRAQIKVITPTAAPTITDSYVYMLVCLICAL